MLSVHPSDKIYCYGCAFIVQIPSYPEKAVILLIILFFRIISNP